jgi:hypothetical protein
LEGKYCFYSVADVIIIRLSSLPLHCLHFEGELIRREVRKCSEILSSSAAAARE